MWEVQRAGRWPTRGSAAGRVVGYAGVKDVRSRAWWGLVRRILMVRLLGRGSVVRLRLVRGCWLGGSLR